MAEKDHPENPVFQPIPLTQILIDAGFWKPRLDVIRTVSLPLQYQWLCRSGVLDNFKGVAGRAVAGQAGAGRTGGEFRGLFFADTDAYKWVEAVSYALMSAPDPPLQKLLDAVSALIAAAQEADGYINTYFQLVEPDKKYTNLGVCHELYTAGHLIEAAVTNFQATGQRVLLNVACRLADRVGAVFGPGRLEAVDGHAGIEMALVRLFRVTARREYLDLARFFIEQRGKPASRLRWELKHLPEIGGRLGKPGQNNRKHYGSFENYDGRYAQDHLPVRDQTAVVGHAARAMYLYCGMADVARETGDPTLLVALDRLWRHLTARRLYITGGIGPARSNEGFTRDFDLPADTACAESCAAAGMVLWNQRMLNATGESRYADLLERVLYNALLVGVSLDGIKYFYNNPLQSHGDCHREEWYECACCPPNIARILASLGGYVYGISESGLAVHLYMQSRVTFQAAEATVHLQQNTRYPWEGKVQFTLEMAAPSRFEIELRIPDWCDSFRISVNDEEFPITRWNGYAVIEREWCNGERIVLDLDMPIRRMIAHPAVWHNAGKVALQRGPLVYCVESADNPFPVEQLVIPENSGLTSRFVVDLCGGIVVIEGAGLIPDLSGWEDRLYRPKPGEREDLYHRVKFRAIPYYCWDNREPGAMVVWIRGNDV